MVRSRRLNPYQQRRDRSQGDRQYGVDLVPLLLAVSRRNFKRSGGSSSSGCPIFFGVHGTVRDFVETLVLLPPSKFTWGIANLTLGRDAAKEVHMQKGDPSKYVRAAIGVAALALLTQVLPTPLT